MRPDAARTEACGGDLDLAWHAHGVTVKMRHRDPARPLPDLVPVVALSGAPMTLWMTMAGLHQGAQWAIHPDHRWLVVVGGALGLLLGQALTYGVYLCLDTWRIRRDRCEVDIGPSRIRVRRGRTVLLDAPADQVIATASGQRLTVVGYGRRVWLWADPSAASGAITWVADRLKEGREQARAQRYPASAAARAVRRVVGRARHADRRRITA